ncbi:MAG: hypothetical protein AB7E47_17635 [Desulfovibrionaceae bacterium]
MRGLGMVAGCVLIVALAMTAWAGDEGWDWSQWDAKRKAAGQTLEREAAPAGRVSGETSRHDPLLDEAGWDWSQWDAKRKARAAGGANGTAAPAAMVHPGTPLTPQPVAAVRPPMAVEPPSAVAPALASASKKDVEASAAADNAAAVRNSAASAAAATPVAPAANDTGRTTATPQDTPRATPQDRPLNLGFALKSPKKPSSVAGPSGGAVAPTGDVLEKTLDADASVAAPAQTPPAATVPTAAAPAPLSKNVTASAAVPASRAAAAPSVLDGQRAAASAPAPASRPVSVPAVQPRPAPAAPVPVPAPPAPAPAAPPVPADPPQAAPQAQPERLAAPQPVAVATQPTTVAPAPVAAAPQAVSAPQRAEEKAVRVAALVPPATRTSAATVPALTGQRYGAAEQDHFLALALYARDEQARDQSLRAPLARPKVITKWRDDVRIGLAGAVSPALRGMVRDAVEDVNRVLKAVCGVRAALVDDEGNVSVFVFPRSPGGDLPGYAALRYGQGGVVQGAEIVLYAGRMTRAVVLRELLNVLGMQGYDFGVRDTVMRPEGGADALSGLDRQALAILYRPEITPGMNFEAVRNLLAELAPRALP